MQYRVQFLNRSADVLHELFVDARNEVGAAQLTVDIEWPPRAVTMRVLDVDGREVQSRFKGEAKNRRASGQPHKSGEDSKLVLAFLRPIVDAFLGKVPGKTGRADTATRMAMDADFSDRGERKNPSRDPHSCPRQARAPLLRFTRNLRTSERRQVKRRGMSRSKETREIDSRQRGRGG